MKLLKRNYVWILRRLITWLPMNGFSREEKFKREARSSNVLSIVLNTTQNFAVKPVGRWTKTRGSGTKSGIVWRVFMLLSRRYFQRLFILGNPIFSLKISNDLFFTFRLHFKFGCFVLFIYYLYINLFSSSIVFTLNLWTLI